jgi:UDP-2,3-diacylglucosamine hydrolase
MKTVFLSDTHLKGPGYAGHEKLIQFFDRLQGRGGTGSGEIANGTLTLDHLVIAGDFFDFWFGRGDTIYPGFRPVVDRMIALKREGVRISLCEGNHDFYLSNYFSHRLGIDVYPEWAEFTLDGLRILVSHGDTVDRGNRKYLALRGFLRGCSARHLQRLLPLKFLWRLARLSSEMSKEMSRESQDRLVELMYRFALEKFHDGFDAVILGHCHKPLLREILSGDREKTFVTLGDWITHDSYLLFDEGRFILQRFLPE